MTDWNRRFFLLITFLLLLPAASANGADLEGQFMGDVSGRNQSDSRSPMFSDESLMAIAASVIADEQLPPSNDQSQPRSLKPYWNVVALLTATTIYDVESTLYVRRRCDECQEANPIARAFVDRGRLATYAYSAAVNGIVLYIARRMYDGAHPWWRVFPVTLAIVHGVAGTWNISRSNGD